MTSSKPPAKAAARPGGIRNVPAPSGSRPSVYSRFIPREELNDFASWSPGLLDGGSEPGASIGVQHPAPPAPTGAGPDHEVQALLHANRQQGYQDGYRDGLAALESFKQSHARQLSTQIGALVQSVGRELDALQQAMADAMAVSATQLARQIVRTELATRPELVAGVAAEALDTLLLSARHITLRVHPDDHGVVVQGAAEVIGARGGRVIADAGISRGGCLVESDIGSIDATMETRWRRAAGVLGCDEAWSGATSDEHRHEARPIAGRESKP